MTQSQLNICTCKFFTEDKKGTFTIDVATTRKSENRLHLPCADTPPATKRKRRRTNFVSLGSASLPYGSRPKAPSTLQHVKPITNRIFYHKVYLLPVKLCLRFAFGNVSDLPRLRKFYKHSGDSTENNCTRDDGFSKHADGPA